jgi:hypothetical protein
VITELAAFVDDLLTLLIGQRAKLLNKRVEGLDQHHQRV